MLKHVCQFLLALFMIFSMTGCSANTEIQNEVEISNIENSLDRNIDISSTKIELITPSILTDMSSQEVESVMENMVTVSATEKLSVSDMIHMGHNFNNIESFVFNVNKDVFESQAISAFNNVYNQCIEQQIPLEDISSWTNIPIAEIQIKYFSGNFSSVESVECKSLYLLNENDDLTVVKAIFDNPALFKNSSTILYDIISCPHQKVQRIGLNILMNFSQSNELIDSSITFSFCRMLNTNSIVNDVLTLEELNKIRCNIIKNDSLDFIAKYYAFCNSDDEEVSNWAQSSLTEVAKHCNDETAKSIKELINFLYDDTLVAELLNLMKSSPC